MNKKIYDYINKFEPIFEEEKINKEVILNYIKENEDVLTRDNKIAHMTASAWIVNKNKTKVLMIYHNIYDSWAWVGGHADGDDDFLHVVNKEIKEEIGLSNLEILYDGIFGLNIVTVEQHVKNGKIVNAHLHFDVSYVFEADEKDLIRIKPDENSGVKWIELDKIKNYVNETKMIPIYERLNKKLEILKIK